MNSDPREDFRVAPNLRGRICGVPVDAGTTLHGVIDRFEAALAEGERLLVSFVNPHAAHLAKDPQYVSGLEGMDLVLCDGIGMALAASLISGQRTQRVSFDATSLAPHVMRTCADRQVPIFLVGGHPGVAERAGAVLRQGYPRLAVAGCYSGYGESPDSALLSIMRRPTSVVIAGLGAGRQERFLIELAKRNWRGVAFTCGGFLDQTQFSQNYYPQLVDRLNLRFAYRLFREPRRLGRRYLIEYLPFLRAILRETRQLALRRPQSRP